MFVERIRPSNSPSSSGNDPFWHEAASSVLSVLLLMRYRTFVVTWEFSGPEEIRLHPSSSHPPPSFSPIKIAVDSDCLQGHLKSITVRTASLITYYISTPWQQAWWGAQTHTLTQQHTHIHTQLSTSRSPSCLSDHRNYVLMTPKQIV